MFYRSLLWMARSVILFACVIGLFASPGNLEAVMADPGIYTVSQPDGTTIQYRQRGDEWNNWFETVEGYSIEQAADGYWYFIDSAFRVTGIKAESVAPASISKHIHRATPAHEDSAGQPFRAKPNQSNAFNGKLLFLLAEFNNWPGTYSEEEVSTSLTGKVHDFYNTASYGNVRLDPANETFGTANNGTVGWINVGYDHIDTRGQTNTSNQQLAKDIMVASDPYVNYAEFDTNADGYVDAVELALIVVVAGYEHALGGTYTPSVHGHRSALYNVTPPFLDGVWVGANHDGRGGYCEFGEIHKPGPNRDYLATVGIVVHELGHLIFSWPDLYDTDYSTSGVGAFCLMSAGSWGKSNDDQYVGQTPVLPCAYLKYTMGWINGTAGNGTMNVVAAGSSSADQANSAYRAIINGASEFFMLENKYSVGYDRGLDRWMGTSWGGIAVWHVDESMSSNANENHRLCDLEEADNTETGEGNKKDLWYAGNKTLFNDSTAPSSLQYSGQPSLVQIEVTSAGGEEMSTNVTWNIGGNGCTQVAP